MLIIFLIIFLVTNVPVAPPRSKHYARKYAARKKQSELDSLISRSVTGVPNRTISPRPEKDQGWFLLSSYVRMGYVGF